MEDGLRRRLVFAGEAAIVEMPNEMRMRVDPAGSDGEAGEIVGERVWAYGAADAGDFRSLDDDDGVGEGVAFAVEDCGGFQDDRASLRGGERWKEEACSDQNS